MRKDLGMPEYVDLNWEADYVATAWKYYQAALASPEVQALSKDAQRYRFCRSQTSPAEIHIHGVELGLAGDSLDEAMDCEMEAWNQLGKQK